MRGPFGSIHPTSFDLTFSLFGIPVRVVPWFWVMSVIMGFGLVHEGMLLLLGWMGVVFVSILIHELGHALTALQFGYRPRIVLYHFGGLAMFEPSWNYTTSRAVLISLAGPGAGFVLYGVVRLVEHWTSSRGMHLSPFGTFVLDNMEFVNLWWGLMNLLPVLPLDGGQVCRDLLVAQNPRRGMQRALQVGMVTGAAVAAIAFLRYDERYIALLFGSLAVGCYMELQERQSW